MEKYKYKYNIIIPYKTQGFLNDANIYKKYLRNSIITYNNDKKIFTKVNIYIDRLLDNEWIKYAKIHVLMLNQEILFENKNKIEHLCKFLNKCDFIFCKTKYGYDYINDNSNTILCKSIKLKFKSIYIGHTTLFPEQNIKKIDEKNRNYNDILYLAGEHSWKNTDIVVKTWIKYNDKLPNIIFDCYNTCLINLFVYLNEEKNTDMETVIQNGKKIYDIFCKLKNVIIKNNISFNEVVDIKYKYALHLCPSLTEGYGHYINEARITKSLVITSNAPPMNEFIIDGESGILIKCEQIKKKKEINNIVCLINTYDLYNAIDRSIKLTIKEKIKMGKNAYEKYKHDKKTFKKKIREFDNMI